MNNISNPKVLAKAMSKLLPSLLGKPLPYQEALELVATLAGAKNWQTYCAGLGNVLAEPLQQEVSEQGRRDGMQWSVPGEGEAYLVPITVDTTATAMIKVRATSSLAAIDVARAYAASGSPCPFEIDEGNYRGLADYYCPDDSSVELIEDTPEPVIVPTIEPTLTASARLANFYGGFASWGQHPKYKRENWAHEVSEGNTGQSYWDYVVSELESNAERFPWQPEVIDLLDFEWDDDSRRVENDDGAGDSGKFFTLTKDHRYQLDIRMSNEGNGGTECDIYFDLYCGPKHETPGTLVMGCHQVEICREDYKGDWLAEALDNEPEFLSFLQETIDKKAKRKQRVE
ncbi:MAG: hypothetical protein Q7S87_03280 [Agitococcus sp.]|nr:hypothetical protein [Agitococcus sp.]MDO9178658.1 hypothetical protein [Agitococcus sp.]